MAGIGSLSDVDVIWNSKEVSDEATRLLMRGIDAASVFLVSRVKELISVPAPRRFVKPRKGGARYVVAATPATPGAPPRKLTGRLRADVRWQRMDANTNRVGVTVIYGGRLERIGHPYLSVAFARFQGELEGIIANPPPIPF